MILTVFRSRLDPTHGVAYREMAAHMRALAEAMPGFISYKTFAAEDGERVSIIEFEPDSPVYLQVSRDELVLHLSEHFGDCSPGAKIFVNTTGLDALHAEIASRRYRYNRPEIATAPWGDRVFEVTDPFSNRILFNEVVDS